MTVGVALLAGGRGRRLGGAIKALVAVGGETILARQRAVLEPAFGWRALVTTEPLVRAAAASWLALSDHRPGDLGPLAGLETALLAAPPAVDSLLLVGCDLPFLASNLIGALRDDPRGATADALVPRLAGQPQPLLARYSRRVLDRARAALDGGERSMRRFVDGLVTSWWDEDALRRFDPALRSFVNVNTPDDLAAAQAMAVHSPR